MFDRAQKALEKMQKNRAESARTEELQNDPELPVPPSESVPISPRVHVTANASVEICETTQRPPQSDRST
jgi:hypothetical protein